MSVRLLLVLALLASTSARASAQETGVKPGVEAKAVLLTMGQCCPDEAWIKAEKKTETELQALGLKVVRVASRAVGEGARRIELGAAAKLRRAACALRIVRFRHKGSGSVQLWLTDRVTRKTVLRTLAIAAQETRAASIVALRVVELLRASLLELNLRRPVVKGRQPQRDPIRPPRALLAIARSAAVPAAMRLTGRPKRPGRFGVRLGLVTLGGVGGTGVLGAVALAGRWSPKWYLSVELEASVSVLGEDVSHLGAKASYDLGNIRGWLLWEILRRGRWRPSLGLGVGVLISWVRGLGAERYLAQTDQAVTGDLAVSAQLAIILTRNLWLRLGVVSGVSLPSVIVEFGSESVATFGLPYFSGSIGLEIRIP